MSQENPPFAEAAKLANTVGQIGCVTSFVSLLVIGVAFGLGRFLDDLLGTGGILTVVLMLGSFPITLFAIVKLSILLLSRAQGSTSVSRSQTPDTPETPSETTSEEENKR